VTNVERILSVLDDRLDHPVRLVLYGRAAISLGFGSPPPAALLTKDVDAIVPLSWLAAFQADEGFWDAQELTNRQLEPLGLYITHLFRADQVFLRRDWEQHLVPVTRPPTRWLQLFRPATLDLILTKMMRGDDPQDMADVDFLIRHDRVTPAQLEDTFATAVLPDLAELREAYALAQPRVRELVQQAQG
jgi:hypothetical protein